ncbi:MAG: hypothetical protein Q8T09_14105 [Candidatus Melainabacteria bacterium]|nr:hypothetical protein [Candidatus Melainabacteria bacterium]
MADTALRKEREAQNGGRHTARNSFLPLLLALYSTLLIVPSANSENKYQSRKAAAASIEKARALGNKMNFQQFTELLEVADKLSDDNFKFEARALNQILCQTKHANALSYCRLASTYTDLLGDEDPTKPAEKYLKMALKLDPKFSQAYCQLAEIANKEGRFSEALKYCEQAIACPNIDSSVYQCKATALANLNRLPEALTTINTSLVYIPDKPELHRTKGSILEGLHRYREALASFRTASALQTNEWTSYQIVHMLEVLNKLPEALIEINKVIAHNPRDGEAYRARAQLKVKNKDLAGAIKDYDTTIELEPTAKTIRDRANLHLQMGHKDLYKRDVEAAKKIMDSQF